MVQLQPRGFQTEFPGEDRPGIPFALERVEQAVGAPAHDRLAVRQDGPNPQDAGLRVSADAALLTGPDGFEMDRGETGELRGLAIADALTPQGEEIRLGHGRVDQFRRVWEEHRDPSLTDVIGGRGPAARAAAAFPIRLARAARPPRLVHVHRP